MIIPKYADILIVFDNGFVNNNIILNINRNISEKNKLRENVKKRLI